MIPLRKTSQYIYNKFRKILSWIRFPDHMINNVTIHHNSRISGNVKIGNHTKINGPAFISGAEDGCEIGKYCAIAHNLRVRVANHETRYLNLQAGVSQRLKLKSVHGASKGKIVIGDGVWIADNVIILSGVTVGNGAIIGAGAVVTKDVEPYSIVAGNPAKFIKYRVAPENIPQLENIDWWNWSENKIKKNKEIFSLDLKNHIKHIQDYVK